MSTLKTIAIRHLNGSSDSISLTSNGNVGIGTSTPNRLLDIISSGDRPFGIRSGGDTPAVFTTTVTNAYLQISGSADVYLGSVSGAFTVTTGGSERMRVDTSGRVIKPAQPSFRAAATDNGSFSSGTIPYSQVITNVGSCYNASTYRFTAPVAGVYIFEAHFLSNRNTNSGDHGFDFYINSSAVKRIYQQASGGASVHCEARGTLITSLNASDYVTIVMYGNAKTGIVGSPQHCQFGGYFLG